MGRKAPPPTKNTQSSMRFRRVAARRISCSTLEGTSDLNKLMRVVHSMVMQLQSKLLGLLQVKAQSLGRGDHFK